MKLLWLIAGFVIGQGFGRAPMSGGLLDFAAEILGFRRRRKGTEVKMSGLPEAQGLYDPRHEHDACGVGFIVDIKNRKSHDIVRDGLEILVKAVTLLIVLAGYVSGHEALAQSMVITLIVIEVVIMTVAVGIIFGVRGHNDSLDARKIRNLKG